MTAIMDEIAATVEATVGASALGIDGFAVSGRMNLDPAVPTIDLYPASEFVLPDPRGFGDEDGWLQFVVRARVNGDQDGRQDLLLALMDVEHDWSITVALEDDQTLNGLASSVRVDGPSGYTVYNDTGGARGHLGCEWRVTVLRARS